MAKRKTNRKYTRKKAINSVIGLIAIAVVALVGFLFPKELANVTLPQQAASAEVKVHSINIGQGDATLLQANGKFALIDAADPKERDSLFNYLKAAGVTELSYFIVTHPHADHIGNAAEIINNFKIDTILLPQFEKAPLSTTVTFEKMLDAIAQSEAAVQTMNAGDEYTLGSAKIEILTDGIESDDQNNISPFIMFSSDDFSFLCSGDAEKEAEQAALSRGISLRANAFKAAHHASKTSNTKALLQAISPSAVTISCGEDNSYGHPNSQVMNTFEEVGAQTFITYETGGVVFYADENGKFCVAPLKEKG